MLLLLAATTAAVFLVACLRKDLRFLGLFITGPVDRVTAIKMNVKGAANW
jgi:hypothetical protein